MSQDTSTLDLDLLPDVPDTGGAFKQYGKLTISTKPFAWRNGKTEEVSAVDWKRLPQSVDGKNAKGVDMVFHVNIQEFRPQLDFAYERKVTVGGVDWNRIVAPSLETIFGKGSMSKENRNATLANLNGKYVAVEDVPQVARKNAAPDAKVYNTIKFVKVYADRAACLHDASEGFAGTASANGSTATLDPMVPEGWGKSDWMGMKDDPMAGIAPSVAKAIAEAEAANKDKPKPVQVRAVAAAKQAAIEKFASDMTCTVEQATALLNS